MKHNTFILTKPSQTILETEILFSVASTRAQGVEFLKLEIAEAQEDKIMAAAVRILRSLKKQGRIQLFISSQELSGDTSTEAQYLHNKYPDLTEICNSDGIALIVKI